MKIKLICLMIASLFCIASVHAALVSIPNENLNNCIQAGLTTCSEPGIGTGPIVVADESEDEQCKTSCRALAVDISNTINAVSPMGGKWMCTATDATFYGIILDNDSRERLDCDCSATCTKGIVKFTDF